MSPSLSLQEIIEELSLANPFNGVCNLEEPPRPSCSIVPQELSLLAKISYVQEQINLLTYNFLPRTFFSLQKHRSLQSILLTAKQILTEALPIRCLEATFVGLYLTQNLNSIDRIPISFKSRANDKIYRHIILAVHLRQQHSRYGAIGLSRKANLMYKAPEFHNLYDLIMDYKKEYELLGHELIDIKLGLSVTHNSYCSLHPCWRFVSLTLKRFVRLPQESHQHHLHSHEHHEHSEQRSRQLSSHSRCPLHRQSLLNKDKQYINKSGHHDKKNVSCSAKVLNVQEASSVPTKALSLSESTTTHSLNIKHSKRDTDIVSDNDESNTERSSNSHFVNKTADAAEKKVLLLPSNKHLSSSTGVSIDKCIRVVKSVSYIANETVNEERESASSRCTKNSNYASNCHDCNNISAASESLLQCEEENVKNVNKEKNIPISTSKVSTQRSNMQAQNEKYDNNYDDVVVNDGDNNNNLTEMWNNEQLINKHEEINNKNVFADPHAHTDSVICNSILKPFHKNDKVAAEHLSNIQRQTPVTSQCSNTTSALTSPEANTASLLSETPQNLIEEPAKQISVITGNEEQKEYSNNNVCEHDEFDALKQFLDKYCQLLSTMSHQYYHRENMSTSSTLTHAAKLNLTARAAQLPFLDLDKAEHDRKSENHRRITHILQLQSPFSAEAMTISTRQSSTTTNTSQINKETCMASASSTLSKKANIRAKEHFDSIKSIMANKETAQHQTRSSSSSSSSSTSSTSTSTSSSSSSHSLSSSSASTHSLPSPSFNVSSKPDATPIATCNNTKTENVQYIDNTL